MTHMNKNIGYIRKIKNFTFLFTSNQKSWTEIDWVF